MVDIELLKRLAEACDIERCADEEERDRNLNEFYSVLEPEDVAALIAENEALRASLGSPDELTADPAGNYDALRLQFLALRRLANMKCRMAAHWQKQCGRETRETLLANAANVNAERDTNALLTDALEAAEAERDQIRAELERLRAERSAMASALMRIVDLSNSGHGPIRAYRQVLDIAAEARRVLGLEVANG